MNNNTVLLVARILLAALFIFAGAGKLASGVDGMAGVAGWVASKGVPMALPLTWGAAIFEVVAGVLILVGFKTRLVSYALAAFCVFTAVVFHNDLANQNEFNSFFKNFAMAGGFLALSVVGAGAFSIDAKRS